MSGEQGERFIRASVQQPESPFVVQLRWLSIRRPPFMIFGFSPAWPCSIVFHFGLLSVAVGPHYILKLRRPK